ncbi:hypothetical protein HT118_06820 [Escherichia coli]|nr:hypothetical protein [Escherichia coli]
MSDMDFDTIMEKAYEEYFEGLAEGEEALSFSEFKQALRIRMRSHNDAEHKYEKQKSDRRKFCSGTRRNAFQNSRYVPHLRFYIRRT